MRIGQTVSEEFNYKHGNTSILYIRLDVDQLFGDHSTDYIVFDQMLC